MAQLTIQKAFELAVQHHQAGRLPQAEQLYRQILGQAEGWVVETRRDPLAVESIDTAS